MIKMYLIWSYTVANTHRKLTWNCSIEGTERYTFVPRWRGFCCCPGVAWLISCIWYIWSCIISSIRLRDMYGIHDQTLVWIRSYLSDRLQRVNVIVVVFHRFLFFGPILYCLHTKSVSDSIHRFGLLYHSYADDTQIYISIK